MAETLQVARCEARSSDGSAQRKTPLFNPLQSGIAVAWRGSGELRKLLPVAHARASAAYELAHRRIHRNEQQPCNPRSSPLALDVGSWGWFLGGRLGVSAVADRALMNGA